MKSASIIIPNYNGRELLQRCLPALIKAVQTSGERHEIILVDDASTDDSLEYVKSAYPEIRIISLANNVGFGRACNIGVEKSSNEIVILLNSDMIVDEGFLSPLLERLEKEENIFAVGGRILPLSEYGKRDAEGKPPVASTPLLGVPGGGAAFDKEKYLLLGGFDSLFYPFYMEDVDLGFCAWRRGWRVISEPRSIIYHEEAVTIRKAYTREYVERMLCKNFFLFVWKNIMDKKLLLQHFIRYPLIFAEDIWVRGGFYVLPAFFYALRQFIEAVAKRVRERKERTLTDKEIFSRSVSEFVWWLR